MSPDPIENLLRETDVACPAGPADAAELARGARALLERGRRRVAATTATAVIGLVVVALTLGHRARTRIASVAPSATRAATLSADLRSLEVDETAETRAVTAMLAVERRDAALGRLRRLRERGDVDQWVRDQNERSALVVLEGAASDTGDAARICRRVIELFPDTAAAAVARGKLLNAR